MAPRLFGTNGIREVVGTTLTAPFVTRIAGAIASVAPATHRIAVGWDGRTSSPAFAAIVSSTLALAGFRVVQLGLLPTPALQYSIPRVGADLGVIVTASHNPPEFNGVKLIAADGLEAPREVEAAIEAAVEQGTTPTVPFDRVGEIGADSLGGARYLDGIVAQVDRPRIAERRFSVVLDCANGASVVTSPLLLRRLGCRVTTLNGHIDGTFPGHASEPLEAHLQDLLKAVPAVGADLGVAHDGDADRAIFVDASGRYIPGEETLTLLARETVEQTRGGVVVVPVSTTRAVEDAIRPHGGSVVYSRVGSPAVSREMQRRSAVFGGEDNGGLIFPRFQIARDGAMTLAAMLDLLARRGSTLAELLRDVPRYPFLKEKVPCPVALREPVLKRAGALLEAGADRVDRTDGIKVDRGGGWLLLRPSGTEPLFRIIAEGKEPGIARALIEEGRSAIETALRELSSR